MQEVRWFWSPRSLVRVNLDPAQPGLAQPSPALLQVSICYSGLRPNPPPTFFFRVCGACAQMIAADCIDLFVRAMLLSLTDEPVQLRSCLLLTALAAHSSAAVPPLIRAEAPAAVVAAMGAHRQSVAVQEAGSLALARLVPTGPIPATGASSASSVTSTGVTVDAGSLVAGAVAAPLSALTQHAAVPAVVQAACQALLAACTGSSASTSASSAATMLLPHAAQFVVAIREFHLTHSGAAAAAAAVLRRVLAAAPDGVARATQRVLRANDAAGTTCLLECVRRAQPHPDTSTSAAAAPSPLLEQALALLAGLTGLEDAVTMLPALEVFVALVSQPNATGTQNRLCIYFVLGVLHPPGRQSLLLNQRG